MAIFLFVIFFASNAQYKKKRLLQQVAVSYTSNNATSVDSTTLHGNKITLVFCILRDCGGRNCYCCLKQKPEAQCYSTRQECKGICPICNPQCPPQPSLHLAMKG
ncbi:hypothetical protein GQ55_3G408200 [Panicum hallii var. hallii]|uniref:Embryo surrounding factor 1 brassicaceae domain-containing protein n=1 Tax=Panicum hallii var. hallii TaxID=1504633 RepID=A0A2T7EH27_9POAL|nr:hypothetical protein GQ55_3G408200 [Panicum hallii var. hallii]